MISSYTKLLRLNKFKVYEVKQSKKVVYAQQVITEDTVSIQKNKPQLKVLKTQGTKKVLSEVEKPGLVDSKYFTEDENVAFWRDFLFKPSADGPNVDSPQGLEKLREALLQALISARIFRDETSVRYWSYHIARTTFFLALGAASLLANSTVKSSQKSPKEQENKFQVGNQEVDLLNLVFFGPPAEAMVSYHQDLKNIQEGLYKLPWDMTTPLHHQYNLEFVFQNSIQYLQDSVKVLTRSTNSNQQPLWVQNSNMYPEYYQNTFHYQTDGWMSSFSAKIYETQTEVIFAGRQDVMQRHTLIPIHNYLKNKNPANLRALEVASGTGRFATFFKDNYPKIHLTISDLSPFYLEQARKNIDEWKNLRRVKQTGVDFVQAAAENLPFEDNSFDIVYCVYLFHEVPYEVRVKAIKEFSRVLRSGGIVVMTDSYQFGDRLGLDHLIENFQSFNEPWYGSYVQTNFGAIFEEANLLCDQKVVCSHSKTLSAIKPKN